MVGWGGLRASLVVAVLWGQSAEKILDPGPRMNLCRSGMGDRHVAPAVASSSPDMVRTLVPRFVFGEDESGEDYEKTSLMTLIGLPAPP